MKVLKSIYLSFSSSHLDPSAAELLRDPEPGVDRPPHVPLQSPPEVLEHGGAAGEDDVAVEAPPDVDRAVLHHAVHSLGDRHREVRVGELQKEK